MTAFIGGFWQFFIPTHLLAVVAVGLLAAWAGLPKALAAMFAPALGAGSLLVAAAIPEMPSGVALLVIAALAAALVIAGRAVPTWAAGFFVGAAGATIPVNAPPHEITIPAAIAAQCGTAFAALVSFAAVALIASHLTRPWQRIGVRIVASWIAASAILVLALRLAR